MYDAIVVGARCAGASTAWLLASKGHRVLLVDRAAFPSDIPHGHFIHRHGPQRLQRWGLLDRIAATSCPPVTSFTSDLGDFPLVGTDLAVGGVPMGYGPRRTVVDAILVEAAVAAGAELRESFTVEGFTFDGARITGIRGRRRGGSSAEERATVTVGADGRNSRLARTVGAEAYESHPPVSCWYWSYWSGYPSQGLELYLRPGRVLLIFPTNDGLTGVFVGFHSSDLPEVRRDVEGRVMAAIDAVPEVAQRVRGARREVRYLGASDLPNFLRRSWGDGWALVGDAGCHKDPLMALGMCDAFRDAELLADALHEALAGLRPAAEALADYERRRDEATLQEYRINLERARLQPPPPEAIRLRAALRDNPEATRRFFLAEMGLVPRETFFNPENLAALVPPPERAAT